MYPTRPGGVCHKSPIRSYLRDNIRLTRELLQELGFTLKTGDAIRIHLCWVEDLNRHTFPGRTIACAEQQRELSTCTACS